MIQTFVARVARDRLGLVATGVAMIGLLLVRPAPAAAYRTAADLSQFSGTARVAWPQDTVTYYLDTNVPVGMSFADFSHAAQAAAQTWNDQSCSTLTFYFSGEGAIAPAIDGITEVEWVNSGWAARGFPPSGGGIAGAAITDVTYSQAEDGTWSILDADIYLNGEDVQWSASGGEPPPGTQDLQSVLTHEMGHVLGLLHPCEPGGTDNAPDCNTDPSFANQVMYPFYVGTSQRVLDPQDVAGLCFLYPAPPPCEQGACSAGMTCTADGCRTECAGQVCASGEACIDSQCMPQICQSSPCDQACNLPECSLSPLGDPCEASTDCRSGQCSASGYCTLPCAQTDECPLGYVCTDNECEPDGRGFGAGCNTGNDCANRLCLDPGDGWGICTRECGPSLAACPDGFTCETIQGHSVCTPPISNTGCSAGGAPTRSPGLLWGLLLIPLGLIARRRRR